AGLDPGRRPAGQGPGRRRGGHHRHGHRRGCIPSAGPARSGPVTEPFDGPAPVVAVVGRPNGGKSTLVNRLIGRRQAVVGDVPGVPRERVAYDALWSGRRFTVVDTGGWEPDAKDRAAAIAAQAEIAVATADVVLFVVDSTVGATDVDEAAVRMLRRSAKPVLLVANKVDDP